MIVLGEILMYITSYFGLFAALFFLLTLFENRNHLKNPKPQKVLPTVTVMVPACNEEFSLSKTIKSLLNLDYPKNKLQIIIIDDGSVDNTYKIAKEWAKKHKCIRALTKPNGGKGTALNLGLKYTTGEIVGCLDADSVVDSDCLLKMVGYFKNKNVGAVTPSLKCTTPKTIWQRIQTIEFLLGVYLRKVFSFLGAIHVTPGPFTMFRKSFFDKTGGYDETTVTEDIEVALRLQSKGYEIENAMDANVYAIAMPTFLTTRKQRVRWYRGFLDNVFNYKNLFSKKYGNLGLFVLPSSFASIFLAITVSFYLIYHLAESLLSRFTNLYMVGFDIWKLKWFNADPFFINNSPLMWLGWLSIAMGIFVIFFTKWASKEKDKIAFNYILFAPLYLPLFSYWWIESLYCKLAKGKVEWKGRKREAKELEYC